MPGRAPTRRSFFKQLNVLVGAVIGAAMAVPIVRYVLFPVRRRIVQGGDEPTSVAQESAIPAAGSPVRVEIVAREQKDAWAKVTNVRQGAAWLVRGEGGQIQAFSTSCPHLGCAIDFDEKANQFRCPCHTSAFDLNGQRVSGPAKRGMDPLEVEVKDGEVKVRYEKFATDIADRVKV